MKYEVILFDADETLFDFKKSEKEAFKNSMIEFKFDYEENYHLEVYKNINTAIWKEFEEGLITQEKLKVERFKRLSDKLEVKFDELEFAKAYMKHLSLGSFLYDESEEILNSLYGNHRMAIITNGLRDVQNGRIKQSKVAHLFEAIIVSEEVNVSKPNPKIFEITLDSLKFTDKSKVLMVGDSLTSDISGGINYGVDTCWYNPGRIKNSTSIKPTYEINSLYQLNEILK